MKNIVNSLQPYTKIEDTSGNDSDEDENKSR